MLNFELLRQRNLLIVTPDGPLEKADFQRLAKEVEGVISSKGMLTGLLIYVAKFPGWRDFGAFASHLKFVANYHRRIERIAAVTNSKTLKTMSSAASYLVHPKIKHFDLEQETEALVWLAGEP